MIDQVSNSIISGAAGGAIAGLVVSILLAGYGLIVAKWRRRDQIKHIREMVTNEREQLYSIFDEESVPADPLAPSSDVFRYVMFQGMRRELELALNGRSSEITFDEVRQIRRIFVGDGLIRDRAPDRAPDRSPEGSRHYDKIFGDLEKIEWLKLPKRGSAV